MTMHDPPPPGEVLRDLYLDPAGLTVTETAARLGVSRTALSQLLNGRSKMSIEMSARLAKAFGTTVDLWLNLEHQRTLWLAQKNPPRVKVSRILRKRPKEAKFA